MIRFTVPSCSTTNVARFASPTTGIVPPYSFATLPPSSDRSVNGRPYFSLNRRCVSTESVEIPTTCACAPASSAYRSRYAWTSRVQPGVNAFT